MSLLDLTFDQFIAFLLNQIIIIIIIIIIILNFYPKLLNCCVVCITLSFKKS